MQRMIAKTGESPQSAYDLDILNTNVNIQVPGTVHDQGESADGGDYLRGMFRPPLGGLFRDDFDIPHAVILQME